MLEVSDQNPSPFEKKVRVRVCGILKEDDKILLLKHQGIGEGGFLWSPPGGGVEFGQSLKEALKREFKEETNIDVSVEDYLFTNEHMDHVHHALEFFFNVRRVSGALKLGFDPELRASDQVLSEAKFFSSEELDLLANNTLHRAFVLSNNKIDDLQGLITFKD